MSRDENTALVALFSFLAGGLVGAAVAFLMAPQSGKKTRKQIREIAEEMREQAVEYAEKVKGKVF